MLNKIKRFMREEAGRDFAEYALILGAVGVVATAVIARYRDKLNSRTGAKGMPFKNNPYHLSKSGSLLPGRIIT